MSRSTKPPTTYSPSGGFSTSPVTGRAEGSLPDLIVREAMTGGGSKAQVLERVVAIYDPEGKKSKAYLRQTFYKTLAEATESGRFSETWALVPGEGS